MLESIGISKMDCTWKLDVAIKEGGCRIRRNGTPEIMSDVRHVAVNRLQSETSFKKGVRAKQMKANRNTNHLKSLFWQAIFDALTLYNSHRLHSYLDY